MKHIAIDLGASNGRVAVCSLSAGGKDTVLDVVHRFTTHNVELPTGVHWNIPGIYEEILTGLRQAFSAYGDSIVSLGIDSWGVDHTLMDSQGEMLYLPYHYRDERTDSIPEEFFQTCISSRDLFRYSGVQIMQLNSVFQLYAMKKHHPHIFSSADRYLSVPDLLTFWLTGEYIQERSHASTTGLFNPSEETWAWEVIEKAGLPSRIFREIIPSGTVVGPLRDTVARKTGAPSTVRFIASASHDTQSAAYTIGNQSGDAFLSCGTWSIIGIEQPSATLSDSAFANSFSNEASGFGGYNLLKNIMGLWILQECKAQWDEEISPTGSDKSLSHQLLIDEAEACSSPDTLLDVNDPLFLKTRIQAGSMCTRINKYLTQKGGTPCRDRGEYVRLIIESLAAYYGQTIRQLEEISGNKIGRLHLIGGGAKNQLLARLTGEKAGIKVIVGESEATAVGNVMIQQSAFAPQ